MNVVGSSSNPNVATYECTVLSNDAPSSVTMEAVENTISERQHPSPDEENDLYEVNFTIFARELFSEDNIGFPYGSNPRLPVLCPTFTDIYETATDVENKGYLDFIAFNTGVDVFVSGVRVDGNTIEARFAGPRDGIANGGLTYGVLQYVNRQGLLPEDLRVSIRLWSRQNQTVAQQTKVADKRNSHRPLSDIDKMNTMGAFTKLTAELDDAFVERIVWHTGDQTVDQDQNINVQHLCRLLHTFKRKQSANEAHPTLNPLPADAIESVSDTIEKSGVVTSPTKGLETMWEAVGGEQ